MSTVVFDPKFVKVDGELYWEGEGLLTPHQYVSSMFAGSLAENYSVRTWLMQHEQLARPWKIHIVNAAIVAKGGKLT